MFVYLLSRSYPKGRKSICADFEITLVYPIEEIPKHAIPLLWLIGLQFGQSHCRFPFLGFVIEDDRGDNIELQSLS